MRDRSDPPPSEPTPATAWPDGVIARYLTLAGQTLADPESTVDVTSYPDEKSTQATCRGCGQYDTTKWRDDAGLQLIASGSAWAESDARDWAQSHAETCRAMAKPVAK